MNLVSYGEGNWYVGAADESEKWQWQPISTAHDPNPPITLENAAGATVVEADANATGAAVVTGVAAAVWNALASSVAAGTATGFAAAVAPSVAASDGIGTPTGIAAAVFAGVGGTQGSSTVTGFAATVALADGASSGIGEAQGVSAAVWAVVGASEGIATASGEGEAVVAEGPFTRGYTGPKQKQKKRKKLREDLTEAVYALERVPAARPVLKQALQPYASKPITEPSLPAIDFSAVMEDMKAVERIMAAYTAFLIEEDEDEDQLVLMS